MLMVQEKIEVQRGCAAGAGRPLVGLRAMVAPWI